MPRWPLPSSDIHKAAKTFHFSVHTHTTGETSMERPASMSHLSSKDTNTIPTISNRSLSSGLKQPCFFLSIFLREINDRSDTRVYYRRKKQITAHGGRTLHSRSFDQQCVYRADFRRSVALDRMKFHHRIVRCHEHNPDELYSRRRESEV